MIEAFPNEIILLIFSHLELTALHRAFSSLNSRFESLLYNNLTPLYARLPSNFILPLDQFSSRIRNLSLINWNPDELLSLLDQPIFPLLKSLQIQSSDNEYFGQPINDLIHQIISFPNLYKCQIDLAPTLYINDFPLAMSHSIRELKLSMITLDMLFCLLTHVPELRFLHVWINSNGRRFESNTYDQQYSCLKLKKLSIGLHSDLFFAEILFLLRRMPVLHSLEMSGSVWDREFLVLNHWENILLGQDSSPVLNQMKINISVRYTTNMPRLPTLVSELNKETFRGRNFSITYDRTYWFRVNCLWNNRAKCHHGL